MHSVIICRKSYVQEIQLKYLIIVFKTIVLTLLEVGSEISGAGEILTHRDLSISKIGATALQPSIHQPLLKSICVFSHT